MWKTWLRRGALAAVAVSAAALIADAAITRKYAGRCVTDAEHIPAGSTALLLGTGKYLASGYENPMYRFRIEAAAALWHSGRVDYVLASGDNSRKDYDEPSQMTIDLVDAGVPFDVIYRDYAGFRTLDSVVRAKRVFGLDRGVVIVSQPFHNERALFLADAAGVEAMAWNAKDVPYAWALKTRVREKFARLAAYADVYVLRRQPKFLGPRIELGAMRAP